MQTEPPLFYRIWFCLSSFNRWAKRRKIDKAALILTNNFANDEEAELGYKLRMLSDKLWDEEFSRYNK